MASHSIVPATPEHIIEIARNIRPPDVREVWASCMRRPLEALQAGLQMSELARVGMVHGKPVCAWGVVRESLLFNSGIPWMLGTKELENHAVKFLRNSKPELMKIFENYDLLENYVDARNTLSIRWLKWLGFKFDEAKPYGVFGLPFHRFSMEKEHV